MIYLDMNGFDRLHYKFDYVRREFLGEVRCLVFDVDPLTKSDKGRFVGRIWVEDQDYHIVRFNGAYGGSSMTATISISTAGARMAERTNGSRPSSTANKATPKTHRPRGWHSSHSRRRPAFGATPWPRLGRARNEQCLVEAATPVKDQTETANDYSPLQAERSWRRSRRQRGGQHGAAGLDGAVWDVDKLLETVVNNLEVTNELEIQPDVRCRVLMISTLESFTIGHTIVLSRGLVDVLPDEASLAPSSRMNSVTSCWTPHGLPIRLPQSRAVRREGNVHHFGFTRAPEENRRRTRRGSNC